METESTNPEVEAKAPEHKNDVKADSPFEFWLKRQFPHHSLRSMREALRLHSEGAPVPFIALYKKNSIETLRSSDLYKILDARTEWEEIFRKQEHLLQEIQAQGKLTDELKTTIQRSHDLDRLEDLYVPFKLKRQSLGAAAREAGLGPLANYIWDKAHGATPEEIPGDTLEQKAEKFAKADTKFVNAEAVLKGVQDIFVERIAENFELRTLVRNTVLRRSKIRSVKGSKAKGNSKYAKYFEYQEPIGSLKKANASHRYLAMRKGWMEDELVLSFERPEEGVLLEKFEEMACPNKEALGAEVLVQAARLALKGSVYTVMENEAHRGLKEEAEKHVIEVMAENLRKKLLYPAFGAKAVLGIDPGTANHPCALALIDNTGKFLLHLNFKLEEATDSMKEEFIKSLESLGIQGIAVAHGPRAKEVRDGFRQILTGAHKNLPIVSVHEHSANIYASSPAAKEEFPELDINTRRAIFVARYFQDPLSALLRLETKFFSLGELQHEVNQNKLRHTLQEITEFSVNYAGVDVNTAPAYLLAKVAGLNIEIAKAIVQLREANGAFKTREELKKVPGMTEKAYLYSAGFLKIKNSDNKLESSHIHPMYYPELESFAKQEGASLTSLSKEALEKLEPVLAASIDPMNAKSIVYELQHLGEDPRGPYEFFEENPNLKTITDLQPNTLYRGVVTNVTSFGAFVDIGIEQDGLVHISELTGAFAKNPYDSLFPGDAVNVFVTNVNAEKKQISLTMKSPAQKQERRPRTGDRPQQRRPRRPEQAPQLGADGQPIPQEARPPRPDRRPQRQDNRGPQGEGGREERPRREDRPRRDDRNAGGKEGSGPPKPKRPPQRDSKTGAIMKNDQEYSKRDGPRVPSKAAVTTFNPFANLANMLKDKDKEKQNS